MKIISNKKWGEIQEEILALKKEKQQLLARVTTKTKELAEADKKSAEAQLSVAAANKTTKKFEAMYREEKAKKEMVEEKLAESMRMENIIREKFEKIGFNATPSSFEQSVVAETKLRKSNAIKTAKKNATSKKKA